MDDRNFEQQLASARLTVEDLARAGDLSAVDRRTLLLAFSRRPSSGVFGSTV